MRDNAGLSLNRRSEYQSVTSLAVASQVEEIIGLPPGNPSYDRGALRKLQERERAMAVAGYACDGAFVAGFKVVEREDHARLIDSRRAQPESVRAALVTAEEALGLRGDEG